VSKSVYVREKSCSVTGGSVSDRCITRISFVQYSIKIQFVYKLGIKIIFASKKWQKGSITGTIENIYLLQQNLNYLILPSTILAPQGVFVVVA